MTLKADSYTQSTLKWQNRENIFPEWFLIVSGILKKEFHHTFTDKMKKRRMSR